MADERQLVNFTGLINLLTLFFNCRQYVRNKGQTTRHHLTQMEKMPLRLSQLCQLYYVRARNHIPQVKLCWLFGFWTYSVVIHWRHYLVLNTLRSGSTTNVVIIPFSYLMHNSCDDFVFIHLSIRLSAYRYTRDTRARPSDQTAD
jgi:hypothetical protein